VEIDEVLSTFTRARTKLNVVVLDACRNNPFSDKATGKGLAQMDAPASTLLAYATAPGNVADDGPAGNGLYTAALLPEIKKPEQRIEDIFKRTRFSVRRQSLGRQIPWESTSLEDDFYFLPPASLKKASNDEVKREVEVEFAAWNRVKESREPDTFIDYLRTFPSGRFAEFAQFRLDQLSRPVVVAQAGKGQEQPIAPGALRIRLGDRAVIEIVDHAERTTMRLNNIVTRADENVAEINNGEIIINQLGAVLRDRRASYDPGRLLAPAELSLGKKWRTAFHEKGIAWQGEANTYIDLKVVGRESLTVPAGTSIVIKSKVTDGQRATRVENFGRLNSNTRCGSTRLLL
jgi:hypothetical protein